MAKQETAESPGDELDGVKREPSRVHSVRSEELLRGCRELRIVHGSEVYRLILTRNNKLILQK